VETGETVGSLAARYGVAVEDIEELNDLDRREPLAVGLQVFVPGGKKGGEPSKGKGKGKGDKGGQGKGLRASTSTSTSTLKGKMIWPVRGGKLSSGFGQRGGRPHEGIDIAAPRGTAVVAAADGLVIYAGDGVRGYGNMIIIRHAGELVSVYAHNHRNHVTEGVEVKAGQVIAEVGATGRTSGNHLHFEIRRGETPLDPQRFVKQK